MVTVPLPADPVIFATAITISPSLPPGPGLEYVVHDPTLDRVVDIDMVPSVTSRVAPTTSISAPELGVTEPEVMDVAVAVSVAGVPKTVGFAMAILCYRYTPPFRSNRIPDKTHIQAG